MTKINSLDDIVKNGLCIGCGICKSIAGNSIEMEMSDKGNLEPKELTTITNDTLEEIKKVCPGVIAEGPENYKENEISKFHRRFVKWFVFIFIRTKES